MDTARKWQWRWGLVAGVVLLGVAAAVAWPSCVAGIEKERTNRRRVAADKVFSAIRSGVGFPADLGVHSTQEYLDLLIRKGFLQLPDLALFGDLVLANASKSDPPNTAVLVSRSYYNYLYHETRLPKEYVVIRLGGAIVVMRQPLPKADLPPREPSILPPRRLALD